MDSIVAFGPYRKVLVLPTKLSKCLNLALLHSPRLGQTAPLTGGLTYSQNEVRP